MQQPKLPRKERTGARPSIQRPQEWGSVIKALAGNFDWTENAIGAITKGHNRVVDDLRKLRAFIEEAMADTALADHTHNQTANGEQDGGTIYAAGIDHGGLGGLADDDHTAYLKERASGGVEAEVPTHNHTATATGGTLTNDVHPGYSQYTEIATPSTPAADTARIYVKDSGGGKTQLVVIFSGGAEIVIAEDP